jgi:hypothetical protein
MPKNVIFRRILGLSLAGLIVLIPVAIVGGFLHWNLLVTLVTTATLLEALLRFFNDSSALDMITATAIIYPNLAELQELYQFALQGNLSALNDRLVLTAEQKPDLTRFAQQFYPLIENLQVEACTELLEQAIANCP